MKIDEFKKRVKPIVKDCVKEILLEGGMLSGIIAEVMKGVRASQPQEVLREQRQRPQVRIIEDDQYAEEAPSQNMDLERQMAKAEKERQARIARVNAAAMRSMPKKAAATKVDLFENINQDDVLLMESSEQGAGDPADPLRGINPNNPGVPIDQIFRIGGHNWGNWKKS